MNNDEFELIQLAIIHLTSSNRQFVYVILYFLTQCIRNKHFCSNETNKLRVKFLVYLIKKIIFSFSIKDLS
jgi:hypothetical protein